MNTVHPGASTEKGSITMTIGDSAVDSNDGGAAFTWPGGELAAALKSATNRRVRVMAEARRLVGDITVDIVVSGPGGTFGILCDAIDSARIHRNPEAMEKLGLRSVYCVSALDSLMDPVGVAHTIARHERGYFRVPLAVAGAPVSVKCVRRDDAPGVRLPRQRPADGPASARSSRAA